MLWRESDLVGVIDWLAACNGPLGIDLSRWGLNSTLRGADDDQVLESYLQIARADVYHPHWDVVDAVDILPAGDEKKDSWPTEDSIWAPDASQRLEVFIGSALAELG